MRIDVNEIGSDFRNILEEMGEKINIQLADVPAGLDLFVSMVPATKAAYNMVDREYLFLGEMALDENVHSSFIRGTYFTRYDYPNYNYILLSVIPNILLPNGLASFYACQCNENIDIQKLDNAVDPITGEDIQQWVTIFSGINCFFNTVVRSEKSTQDGSFDQTIYNLTLPAHFKLSPNMRVSKESLVDGEIKRIAYKVENADTTLTDLINGQLYGVCYYQLSKDMVVL